MEITREFQYDLPDDYLSYETTLGLKADWTYIGPDKVWVFVDKKTNKLLKREGCHPYDDEVEYEKQLLAMERCGGVNSYPVLLEFEKDPLLVAAIAVPPPEMKDMEVKNYYHHETGEWIYARPNPTTPCHTIQVLDCEYDLDKKEWKKPYPWKVPHITREEYVEGYNNRIKFETSLDTSNFTEGQKKVWEEYLTEFKNHLVKFEKYLDTPWIIKEPENPFNREDWQTL